MTEKPNKSQEILEQLRELGQNLEQVIRRAWESDQGREIREQFSKGLAELNEQVEQAIESARASETTKNLQAQVKDSWDSVGGQEISENLREGIGDALVALNEQINRLAETIPSGSASEDGGQDVVKE